MQLYLAATPDHLQENLALTPHLAHVAFRVGEDGTLLTRFLPPALRGGVMVLQCEELFPVSAVERLSCEVLRTCIHHNFSGVVLDAPDSPSPPTLALAQQLQKLCKQYQRRLYLPECYAQAVPEASVLICTALSGGSLQQRLQEAVEQYDASRIALDLQRLAMEFPLPCPTGEGAPLGIDELRRRASTHAIYYCDALCARYFTCRCGGKTHFVLFDDAETLRRKMALAEAMGITEAFVVWPEVGDIVQALFDKKKEGEP